MHALNWISFGVVVIYLTAFFAMSAVAARAAGRSIWLFGTAAGSEKAAAIGFRAAFAITIIGPAMLWIWPNLQSFDPLWRTFFAWWQVAGVLISVAGAMVAFAAQISMGTSWRVGVRNDAVGSLISGGLYDFSRNPTFVGQGLLLAGAALATPSMFTLAATVLFAFSAHVQVKSEEKALLSAYGKTYGDYMRRVPRWLGMGLNNG